MKHMLPRYYVLVLILVVSMLASASLRAQSVSPRAPAEFVGCYDLTLGAWSRPLGINAAYQLGRHRSGELGGHAIVASDANEFGTDLPRAETVARFIACDPMPLAQLSAIAREVLATDDRRTDALRRGDPAPLREIYADDYTLVTPAGVVRTKAEQIIELESGELRYRSIEVAERSVRVYDDVAVVVSRDTYDILLRGQKPGGHLRFTRVYKKFGKQWRLIATHGTTIRD